MSKRLRGRHRRADLPEMLAALDEALEALDGTAPEEAIAKARAVADRAGERLRLSGEHTVVALAGSTGSGKSSLFNALSGGPLSPVGVRRPTTARAHACVWGMDGAVPLVQWLGVPRRQTHWRHRAGADGDLPGPVDADAKLDGLVLLDLPDHDSDIADHRLQVDRLVELVDLLVWVVDPQKYADGVLHERYLQPLAGHDAVIVVVLNQIDTLNPFAVNECVDDLRRLVRADGLRRARVLAVSARTGANVDALRTLVADAVRHRRARNDRLVADVEDVVDALEPAVGPEVPLTVGKADREQLLDAFAGAAGVPVVGDAVERSWRLQASASLGWPLTRWVRRLRPDPLRRLHLSGRDRGEVRSALVRSSIPEPTPVQEAQVETAVRRVCDASAEGLPPPWRDAVRGAAADRAGDVRDALDKAVVGTDLGVDRKPLWWRFAAFLHWVFAAAALVGAGWLALLAASAYLRLPEPPTPAWNGLAVPTALLLGGVLLGLGLALVGRLSARGGAKARRWRAESRLRASIGTVAEDFVLAPVGAELARHERARGALQRARTG